MAALPDAKVLEMAEGLTQPAAIVRYFRKTLKIRAERKPNGKVLVLEEWLRDTADSNEPKMNL